MMKRTSQRDYQQYLELRGYIRGCPSVLLRKVRKVCARPRNVADIDAILAVIKEEFKPSHYIVSTTRNFRLSRFLSVQEIVRRRLGSCGALATVARLIF